MPPTTDIEEAKIARMERMLNAQKWIIGLTASAVLWGARLEFASTNHGERIQGLEADSKIHDKSISEIQGRLHNIADQAPNTPNHVAAKIQQ